MRDPVRRFAWVGVLLLVLVTACSVLVSHHLVGAGGGRLVQRAYAMVENGDYGPAVCSLEEAIAQQPDDSDLHDALADVLEALGLYDKALAHRILCAEMSSNMDARRKLAQAYVTSQRYDRAISVLDECVQMGGANEALYRFLAFCYAKTGARAQAEDMRAMADSLAGNPKNPHRCIGPTVELKQYM